MKIMYCKNCGIQLEDNANFCPKCGSSCIRKTKPKSNLILWIIIGIIVLFIIGSISIALLLSFLKPNGETEVISTETSTTERSLSSTENELSALIDKMNDLELRICTKDDGTYDWGKYWELSVYKDKNNLVDISSSEEYRNAISSIKNEFGEGCQDDNLVASAKKEMDEFINNMPSPNEDTNTDSTNDKSNLNIALEDYVKFFLENNGLNNCNYELKEISEALFNEENQIEAQSYMISYEIKNSINGWYSNYFSIYAGEDGYTAIAYKESGEFLRESYHSYTDGLLGYDSNLYVGGYKLVMGIPIRKDNASQNNNSEKKNEIMLPEDCDPTFPQVTVNLDNIPPQHAELFLDKNLEMIKQGAIILAEEYIGEYLCYMVVEDTDIEGETSYATGTFISPDCREFSFWIEITNEDINTLSVEIIDENYNTLWKH